MAGIDKYTKLMLHMEGVDGSTHIIDSSPSSRLMTPLGDDQLDIGQSKFGGSSLLLDGTGDYTVAGDSDDWDFGSGDFTIDFWFRSNGTAWGTRGVMVGVVDGSAWSNIAWMISLEGTEGAVSGELLFQMSNNGGSSDAVSFSTTTAYDDSTWHHAAVVRNGSNFYMFVDGIQKVSDTSALTCKDHTTPLRIGYGNHANYSYYKGWLDEIRITKGVAKWIAPFTPPTEAYAANPVEGLDDYVKLLVHMDGLDTTTDFTDSSDSAHTVTAEGNAEIDTAQGKFDSPAVLFDGTSSTRLSIPDHADLDFASEDFTIDFWFRINDWQSGDKVLTAKWSIGGYAPWLFSHNGSNIVFFADSGAQSWDIALTRTVATGLVLDQWHHFACTRSGSTYTFFLDGVQTDTLTNGSGSGDWGKPVYIGGGDTGWYMKGHVAEYRLTKGIARWTGAFTPPMAPYTVPDIYGVDSFSKLLLHADGDGIPFVDSSGEGHTITEVGDAIQDAGASKFGGKSLLLDGTGDWLTAPDSEDWDFETDDFTVEGWFKGSEQSGTSGTVISVGTDPAAWSTIGWFIRLDGTDTGFTGQVLVQISNNGGSGVTMYSGGAYDDNTFHHVALVRYGNVFTLYLDGIAKASLLLDITCLNMTEPLKVGNMGGINEPFTGSLDEIRISKGIARWTGSFTPMVTEYTEDTGPPAGPVDTGEGAFLTKTAVPSKWRQRQPRNPGFSVTPGMEVPVSIKMDKWFSVFTPPVRGKPRNVANVTQIRYVDFTVPTLPTIYVDKWLSQFDTPRRKKRIVNPTEFTISFIEVLNPVNGNYWDSGVVGIQITEEGDESQTYADHTTLSFTITGTHVEDFQLEEHETISFIIKTPEVGIESFNIGVPGYAGVNVIIDGENKSNFLSGSVNVVREDNTAARFRLSLELDPDALIPTKPIEFINKVVAISFAAADMDGLVADYIPVFVGMIKGVRFNEDVRTLNISGYDFGGIHQTKGEYISQNITTVLTGAIYGNSATVLSTGHSPIWGVIWGGNAEVEDGQDYFVDTANGTITIPISSRILQFPGSFTYSYSDPMASMAAIIEAVVGVKGWGITEDNVTIVDYTDTDAHPVLSLSDESVIDTCRKFLECSGAKVESNLFPDLRVYSEVENWIGPINTVTVDESIIFENSLVINIDFDNLLNEQTVRTVQKVNAAIEISGSTVLATFQGSQNTINPFTIQGGSNINGIDYQTPSVLVEVRLRKQNINSLSFVSSGTFKLNYFYNSFSEPITGGSWAYHVDGDDFVITLSHTVVRAGGNPGGNSFSSGFSTVHAFPAVDYSLTVYGTKIGYGGTTEDVRVVTAERPVSGISDTLKGDVYENAYTETDTHCVNICNAILLEHGNPYTVRFEMPIYEGKSAQIGDKLNIERDGSIIFSGIIKTLGYTINVKTGANVLAVRAKGVGRGI